MWIQNQASSGADACLRKSDSTPLNIQLASDIRTFSYKTGDQYPLALYIVQQLTNSTTHQRCSENDNGTNTG